MVAGGTIELVLLSVNLDIEEPVDVKVPSGKVEVGVG